MQYRGTALISLHPRSGGITATCGASVIVRSGVSEATIGVGAKLTQLCECCGSLLIAAIAQLVEQLICNQQVGGSNPSGGSVSLSSFSQKAKRRRNVVTDAEH